MAKQNKRPRPGSKKPEPASKPSSDPAQPTPGTPAKPQNPTKVLLLSTRGIVSRYRHLLEDLSRLLPHAKREPKLDSKGRLAVANEIAELRSCDTILLFEPRKRTDLFIHIAKSPLGPTVRFHVANVHTMAELNFTGNCLMYSRALLIFDQQFNFSPSWKLIKELLTHTFTSPKNHRKTKPFIDHAITFYIVDGRIWFRHYQIVDKVLNDKNANKGVESELVEIGPRFVMTPIRIFSGALYGATLWQNKDYISPNEVRRAMRKREGRQTLRKVIAKQKRIEHVEENQAVKDPVRDVFRE